MLMFIIHKVIIIHLQSVNENHSILNVTVCNTVSYTAHPEIVTHYEYFVGPPLPLSMVHILRGNILTSLCSVTAFIARASFIFRQLDDRTRHVKSSQAHPK